MCIKRTKISGDSEVVTLGDPKHYSNAKSAREVNTQLKPEKVRGSEPSR